MKLISVASDRHSALLPGQVTDPEMIITIPAHES